jgi:hypothetical protein
VELLAEFCSGMLTPDDPKYCSAEYISWLSKIETQLCCIRREMQQLGHLHDPDRESESVAVKELFVLAIQLYVERGSKQLVGTSKKTDEWIEDAFSILSEIEQCNKPFALFILGREARTDERRLLILQIIDRTMEGSNAGNLAFWRECLTKVWVRQDLNAGGDVDQPRTACSILSFANFVPCLL